jgi:hypothetical protein
MKDFTIQIEDKTFDRMMQMGRIKKCGVLELFNKFVATFECDDAQFEMNLASAKRHQAEKEHREYCNRFPKWKSWVIERKGDKFVELGFGMRPVVQYDIDRQYSKFTAEHLGKYYYELSYCTHGGFASIINKREQKFYPTLKTLKRGVNSVLKQYGFGPHYN